jgi:Methane oxygenase PmoA
MTILTSPDNFRSCWSHARDYGFVAVNPFGLNAFTKAEKKDIVVKKSESLKLGFAVVIHESATEADYSPQSAYEMYISGK